MPPLSPIPTEVTEANRETLRTDAMLHPAPDLPGLSTRPFNDTVLALCGEAGLSLFNLTAFAGDTTDSAGMVARAEALGLSEINRQCLCLLYIVGYPDKKTMLSAVRRPDFYDTVLEWSLDLPEDPLRLSRVLAEWQRYMLHTAASLVKVLPKEADSSGDAPPNS